MMNYINTIWTSSIISGDHMKLKFKIQAFQTDAVAAVVDLFQAQPRREDIFTIVNEAQLSIDAGIGFRNTLELADSQLIANMREVQKQHSLQLTDDISRQFSVEMETGTGKTYVYFGAVSERSRIQCRMK